MRNVAGSKLRMSFARSFLAILGLAFMVVPMKTLSTEMALGIAGMIFDILGIVYRIAIGGERANIATQLTKYGMVNDLLVCLSWKVAAIVSGPLAIFWEGASNILAYLDYNTYLLLLGNAFVTLGAICFPLHSV